MGTVRTLPTPTSGVRLADATKVFLGTIAVTNTRRGYAVVLDRLGRTLIVGTAQGWNPRKTAARMKGDLAGGLQKALTIARSEQMRVYREATRAQYERSGVVSGQRRLSAHDDRVCPAWARRRRSGREPRPPARGR